MNRIAYRLMLLGALGVASLLLMPLERILPLPLPALAVRLVGTIQPRC